MLNYCIQPAPRTNPVCEKRPQVAHFNSNDGDSSGLLFALFGQYFWHFSTEWKNSNPASELHFIIHRRVNIYIWFFVRIVKTCARCLEYSRRPQGEGIGSICCMEEYHRRWGQKNNITYRLLQWNYTREGFQPMQFNNSVKKECNW